MKPIGLIIQNQLELLMPYGVFVDVMYDTDNTVTVRIDDDNFNIHIWRREYRMEYQYTKRLAYDVYQEYFRLRFMREWRDIL